MPEKRILLVEDEQITREILTEAPRREGYDVDSVATAGAATTCLESIPYALVMADRVLPDGDGIDVADAAAQLGSKTLVVSGYLSDLPAGVADRHELLSAAGGAPNIPPMVHRRRKPYDCQAIFLSPHGDFGDRRRPPTPSWLPFTSGCAIMSL
jgi:CheY-like chemotaxis protein